MEVGELDWPPGVFAGSSVQVRRSDIHTEPSARRT
jgi:hypothetical protein